MVIGLNPTGSLLSYEDKAVIGVEWTSGRALGCKVVNHASLLVLPCFV